MKPELDSIFSSEAKGICIAHDSQIADHVYLGNHVTIYPNVRIGRATTLLDGAIVGRPPISNGNTTRVIHEDFTNLEIGERSIVGCHAVLYTGSQIGSRVLIGDLTSIREECVIGDDVIIGRGVMLLYNCRIGDRTRIQDQVHIAGNMVVEKDVFIGMGVTTSNDNDIYRSRFRLTQLELRGPIVRRFAVIGVGATILPGVEIGSGALVAAGSLVTKNVPPWTIVAGVPSRVVRKIPMQWREQIMSLAPEPQVGQ